MKTFGELGTLPKVGDLIIRTIPTHLDDNLFMITDIWGADTFIIQTGHSLHVRHIEANFSPLGQDTQ